jgi:hypothetical protein
MTTQTAIARGPLSTNTQFYKWKGLYYGAVYYFYKPPPQQRLDSKVCESAMKVALFSDNSKHGNKGREI